MKKEIDGHNRHRDQSHEPPYDLGPCWVDVRAIVREWFICRHREEKNSLERDETMGYACNAYKCKNTSLMSTIVMMGVNTSQQILSQGPIL